MSSFLPFALPELGEEEISEVVDSLRSGWITTGMKTKRFENNFCQFLGGALEAVSVNSATAGLHLALEAVGVTRGDEVITTPYTFTATAEVIRYLGAHPVFVDINPKTFNIDPLKIEAAITTKTKAIIPVHFSGLPCDMNAILDIAKRYNLKVVEDAAHALPTRYQGKLIGTLDSDATVYSFYATKTITTGEGGMIVTKNSEVAKRCRVMRLHGISHDAFDRYTSNKPAWYYEVVEPGFKYNMTDLAASLGIHQLNKAWSFQKRRQEIAEYYTKELQDLPLILPQNVEVGDSHAWHLYVIRLTSKIKITRNKFIEEMSKCGIGCSVHFIPLHLQPYWKKSYNLKEDDYPYAVENFDTAVSLPIYTKMTNEDQRRVINTVKNICHLNMNISICSTSPALA